MPRIRASAIVIGLLIVLTSGMRGATGTITPSPFQLILDNNGNPISGGCIWTYTAGTSTPIATYTDVGLSVPNGNPIIASSAGRFTAFLTPNNSYKFIYENTPCNSGLHGSVLVTADNIAATPTTTGTDLIGTAGENLTTGQAVYLSSGAGGKTAGRWYKADATNAYSSTSPVVGLSPDNITSAATGVIRLAGSVIGLSALSTGSDYYLSASTPGALTTAPPTRARLVGRADSTTSIVLQPWPPYTPPVDNNIVDGALSGTSGTCSGADVSGATNIYFTPCAGNRIALYDGTRWNLRTFSELTVVVPSTTATMYDLFAFEDSAGAVALSSPLQWTNDTTRASAITLQDGVWSFGSDTTRRYIGTFRTTGVSGQTENSATKRYIYTHYNAVPQRLGIADSTDTWTYSLNVYRQANASAANQVEVVAGLADRVNLSLRAWHAGIDSTASAPIYVSIGEDSTTAGAGGVIGQMAQSSNVIVGTPIAFLEKSVPLGRHFYAWLERSGTANTTTWRGDNGDATTTQSGMTGTIWTGPAR